MTSAVMVVGPALAAGRTDICYGGGLSLPNFTLNGDATLDSTTNDILINKAANNQKGSVFYNAPFSTAGDLHIHLRINISKPGNGGADGMAFIMTSAASGKGSIGQSGGGIGYQGITPSVVLEFDTYTNAALGDPNNNHIGLTINGDPNHGSAQNKNLPLVNLSTLVPPIALNAQPLDIWLDYTGASNRLQVFINTTATKPLTPVMNTTAVNFQSTLGSTFYMGFSGSTGGSSEQNEILDFYASDVGQPGDACCAAPAGIECTQAPGSATGPVCDPIKNVCSPCTLDNVSNCPADKKACDVSGGGNVCTTPCDGDLGSGAAHACASASFPVCSKTGATAGSCVSCNGDRGTAASKPCGAGAPTCLASGYCGLCSQNADCTAPGATHSGPLCNQSSGVCDSKGTACTTDANCGSSNWCNAGFCTAKLPNGAALPAVAGHTPTLDGTCTTTAAAAVCQSGVCDTKDNRCGYANGDGIPGASLLNPTPTADCRSGVVSLSDGLCGLANGNLGCNSSNAGTVCRSGACSLLGTCVPAGGCGTDADCTSAQYCNTVTFSCATKLTNGTPIPVVPNHNPPLNGTCSTAVGTAVCQSGVCDPKNNQCGYANGDGIPGASKSNPTPATSCQSGVVDPNDGLCGYADGDGTCSLLLSAVCRSGVCSANGVCRSLLGCNVDADCSSAQWCNESIHACNTRLGNGTAIPTDPPHTDPTLDGTCTAPAGALVCLSGVCDAKNNECGYANGSGIAGASSSNPTPVTSCQSAVVDPADGLCGYGDNSGVCTAASAATVCRSGFCSASGVCRPADGCDADADCTGGAWCNRSTHACTPKLDNGKALPTDAAHTSPTLDGTCSDAAATLVCTSGVCDTKSNECGYENGSGITGASSSNPTPTADCQSGVVDPADGLCGYANGGGTCSAADAANVCRSGLCSAGGTCVAAGGCNVDGDCSTGTWCNVTAHACTAVLANGQPIPTDAAHTSPTLDGTCTAPAGALVCASGVCDAKNNECGYENGNGIPGASKANPTPAGDCQSGVVDPNDGLCGYDDGNGTCTQDTAAVVCRSGGCAKSGVCEAPGKCLTDEDCAATQFCDNASSTCAGKLSNGTAIPTIAGHTPELTGTCTDAVGASVCQSGVCDTKDNACGYADGNGTCTQDNAAVVCRSGGCSKTGACESVGKCLGDVDCTATQFCDTVTSLCGDKLANGEPVPTIGGHTPPLDGSCTPDVGAVVCQSGVCDTKDNQCGLADGDGPCTADNGATVCRSGACTDGLCGTSGAGGASGQGGSAGAAGSTSPAGGTAGAAGAAGTGGTGGAGGSAGTAGAAGQGGAGGSVGGSSGSSGQGGSAGTTAGGSGGVAGRGGAGASGATSGRGPDVDPVIGNDVSGDGGLGCQASSAGASPSGVFAIGGLLSLLGLRRRRRAG